MILGKKTNGEWRVAALLIILPLLALATGAAAQQQHGAHGAGQAQASDFGATMHVAMVKMAKDMEAAPMTGDSDKDFLAMMIPHHEGAVEMARLVLIHGRDPLVRKLAEEIIAGQQAEIISMRNRFKILQAGSDANPGGFPALGGTRGPAPGNPGSH